MQRCKFLWLFSLTLEYLTFRVRQFRLILTEFVLALFIHNFVPFQPANVCFVLIALQSIIFLAVLQLGQTSTKFYNRALASRAANLE